MAVCKIHRIVRRLVFAPGGVRDIDRYHSLCSSGDPIRNTHILFSNVFDSGDFEPNAALVSLGHFDLPIVGYDNLLDNC